VKADKINRAFMLLPYATHDLLVLNQRPIQACVEYYLLHAVTLAD